MKWSAILKNKRGLGDVSQPGTFAFHGWIRQSLAENKPYDKFVAEIVAARGDAERQPAGRSGIARSTRSRSGSTTRPSSSSACGSSAPGATTTRSRSGARTTITASPRSSPGSAPRPGPTRPRPGSTPCPTGLATNPLTGEARKPKPLGAPELADLGPYRDPRVELVDWLRQPDNPFFARALVNRYWKHFLGRGLVEPEDDMRVSNPPSNPELLDALADDFVKNGYDLKRLVRTIATSRAYDRSSQPNASNEADRRNFARFYARRLPAEVLLDAVGRRDRRPARSSPACPPSFRATQLPDDGFASYFLDVFGRPKRESVCECERSTEANLSQTLHLLNSDDIKGKLTPDTGRAAKLAGRQAARRREGRGTLPAGPRPQADRPRNGTTAWPSWRSGRRPEQLRQGYEDLIWTLVNTQGIPVHPVNGRDRRSARWTQDEVLPICAIASSASPRRPVRCSTSSAIATARATA